MNKEEALNKIEELKEFIKNYDRKKNTVTKFPIETDGYGEINGNWAFSVFAEKKEGSEEKGAWASEHKASIFLVDVNGTWYDENGIIISGYLFYKPKGE